jgi:uncharacterized protein YndB with AHSA1/START domain
MAKIEQSVFIGRPVSQVFAYATDPKCWTKWMSGMIEAEQTSSGQVGLGAAFRGVNKAMGRRMEWTSMVDEFSPNREWVESISTRTMSMRDSMRFSPVDGGTRFDYVRTLKVRGLLKLLSPMIIRAIRKEMGKDLSTIKAILEAQGQAESTRTSN